MTFNSFDPDRDVTPEYTSTVTRWIASTGEVFVVMRYLGGGRDYAFVKTPGALRNLIEHCPTGTDIIAFRDRQLPIRGKVTDDFIRNAQSLIRDGAEYLLVLMAQHSNGDPRLSGSMGDTHVDLVEDLREVPNEYVSLGLCPQFTEPDNGAMISAAKDGVDGPR